MMVVDSFPQSEDEPGSALESSSHSARVLGIDAAGKHGWLGVLVDDEGFQGAHLGSLREIVAWAEPVEVIGIDIPIGHGGGGSRAADRDARTFVGPRSSSVFPAPPAEALTAGSYAEANLMLTGLGRPKLSQQAWALIPKIVDAAGLAEQDERVFEVHPEVSFCELAGQHLAWSKKSWNGLLLRRRLLADVGIVLPDVIPEIASAVADDVVDAGVVAWTARRIAAGTARTFPDTPEPTPHREVAIWV